MTKYRRWLKEWANKFVEVWTACMLLMVQGDMSAWTLSHVITASKTGTIAGAAFVLTVNIAKIESKVALVWVTGVMTMCADIIAHPTHFGPQWTEALSTGLGAAGLCWILERAKVKF